MKLFLSSKILSLDDFSSNNVYNFYNIHVDLRVYSEKKKFNSFS